MKNLKLVSLIAILNLTRVMFGATGRNIERTVFKRLVEKVTNLVFFSKFDTFTLRKKCLPILFPVIGLASHLGTSLEESCKLS